MGSVDAARQITAGGQKADIYAPADYLDIDLLMKPAGYAEFNIVFAHGRMVLAYSASGVAAKGLPPIAAPGSRPFHSPDSIPKASAKWYEILTMPGVTIGGGHPFLDPGAYRGPMIFQLAEAFYKVPNLYNNLLEHEVITGSDPTGTALGRVFDFQFTYEHNARATASTNPDYRYVDLPDEINMSDPSKDGFYRQNAVVAIPGLGTPQSARTVLIPGSSRRVGHHGIEGRPEQRECDKVSSIVAESCRNSVAERKRTRSHLAGSREHGRIRKVASIPAVFSQEDKEVGVSRFGRSA